MITHEELIDLTARIEKCLEDNSIYPESVNFKQDPHYPNEAEIVVQINWGDWKHDHWRANYLIRENFDLDCDDTVITENDGSDCYSAAHHYHVPRIKKWNHNLLPEAMILNM